MGLTIVKRLFETSSRKQKRVLLYRNTFSWFPLATFQRLSDDNLNLEAFLHPPIKCPFDFESETS